MLFKGDDGHETFLSQIEHDPRLHGYIWMLVAVAVRPGYGPVWAANGCHP